MLDPTPTGPSPLTPPSPPARNSGDHDRAAIAHELQAAVPRPDLERARALAEFSQTARAGRDDHEFAWGAFMAAGGAALTPWRAFQAGLRAQVDRLQS